MTVVVDLGCYTHPRYPEDESTLRLIDRFKPTRYYGFDPHPDLAPREDWLMGVVRANICACAAWVEDGELPYDPRPDRPLAAAVGTGPLTVASVDLARWLRELYRETREPIVLKMDVEGAEYRLIPHLLDTGAMSLVTRLLIEWHEPPIGPPDWRERRDGLLPQITCPVEDW